MLGRWLVALTLVLAVVGCRRVSKRNLQDTEGRVFTAKCDREGVCELSRKEGKSVSPDKHIATVYSPGRVVAICDVSEDAIADITDCRPLVCKKDDDCPPKHGLPHGTCVNDLCTEPSNAVGQDDAIMLCLAGSGLGRTSPAQVERYALGKNCGNPCQVPQPCRQP